MSDAPDLKDEHSLSRALKAVNLGSGVSDAQVHILAGCGAFGDVKKAGMLHAKSCKNYAEIANIANERTGFLRIIDVGKIKQAVERSKRKIISDARFNSPISEGKIVSVVGCVMSIKKISTKSNESMVTLDLASAEKNIINVVIFPASMHKWKNAIGLGSVIVVTGERQYSSFTQSPQLVIGESGGIQVA